MHSEFVIAGLACERIGVATTGERIHIGVIRQPTRDSREFSCRARECAANLLGESAGIQEVFCCLESLNCVAHKGSATDDLLAASELGRKRVEPVRVGDPDPSRSPIITCREERGT